MPPQPEPSPQDRITQLHTLLASLTTTAYPDLPSPSDCKKRASVAFVLRIKPSYAHWPPSTTTTTKPASLEAFFAQEWVQHGDPEVLFIKRASRKGDRWTSHIALPGGKRDPTDADDKAAAVREASEEVGLDVEEYGIECGNLPQRIVTTHWGKKPLLVLCPYIFLLTTHTMPPLRLQPTEVASTHWVPLRSLQSRAARTVVFEDVSSRLANQETGVKKWMLSCILGEMMFAAIALLPTESLYSSETPVQDQLQENRLAQPTRYTTLRSLATRLYHSDLFAQAQPPPTEGPLLLWGLTLGVVSDLLDLLPPHNALTLWTYPTFTPLDVRLVVYLATFNFKERKRAELQAGTQFLTNPAFGYATESVAPSTTVTPPSESTVLVDRPPPAGARADETGLHGLGTGTPAGSGTRDKKAAVATMLEGCVDRCARACLPAIADRARYYDIVRRAVAVALVGRASLLVVLGVMLWRRMRGRGLRLKLGR